MISQATACQGDPACIAGVLEEGDWGNPSPQFSAKKKHVLTVDFSNQLSCIRLYTYHTSRLTESFWALQGLVLYIASPFTFNQSPIWLSRSWNIGEMVPSEAGPTFTSKLPPQLSRKTHKKSLVMSGSRNCDKRGSNANGRDGVTTMHHGNANENVA